MACVLFRTSGHDAVWETGQPAQPISLRPPGARLFLDALSPEFQLLESSVRQSSVVLCGIVVAVIVVVAVVVGIFEESANALRHQKTILP